MELNILKQQLHPTKIFCLVSLISCFNLPLCTKLIIKTAEKGIFFVLLFRLTKYSKDHETARHRNKYFLSVKVN